MWLLIENGKLLNMSLVTDLEPNETTERASAYCAGVLLHGHSRILYDYYLDQRAALLRPAKPENQPTPPWADLDTPSAPQGE